MPQPFSQRHGYGEPDAEITVREGDPANLRGVLVTFAYDAGLSPSQLRAIVCRVLMVPEETSNWKDFPNIDEEVRGDIRRSEWFYLYDIIQEIVKILRGESLEDFQENVNEFFRRKGYGWQLIDGEIQTRGSGSFETPVRGALDELERSGRTTAHSELEEALRDISRRPTPDITGAIQHAMAALECLARDISGREKETLGEIIKNRTDLFPKPLDQVVQKLWGYTSNEARHLEEGGGAEYDEAEFVVHLSSALCTYLMTKFGELPFK